MGSYIYSLRRSRPLKVKLPDGTTIKVYRFQYHFKPNWCYEYLNDKHWSRIHAMARHWEGSGPIYWTMGDPDTKWYNGERIFRLECPQSHNWFNDEGSWYANQRGDDVAWTCTGIDQAGKPIWNDGHWRIETSNLDHPLYAKALLDGDAFRSTREDQSGPGGEKTVVPTLWVREPISRRVWQWRTAQREQSLIDQYGPGSVAWQNIDHYEAHRDDPNWVIANPWRDKYGEPVTRAKDDGNDSTTAMFMSKAVERAEKRLRQDRDKIPEKHRYTKNAARHHPAWDRTVKLVAAYIVERWLCDNACRRWALSRTVEAEREAQQKEAEARIAEVAKLRDRENRRIEREYEEKVRQAWAMMESAEEHKTRSMESQSRNFDATTEKIKHSLALTQTPTSHGE